MNRDLYLCLTDFSKQVRSHFICTNWQCLTLPDNLQTLIKATTNVANASGLDYWPLYIFGTHCSVATIFTNYWKAIMNSKGYRFSDSRNLLLQHKFAMNKVGILSCFKNFSWLGLKKKKKKKRCLFALFWQTQNFGKLGLPFLFFFFFDMQFCIFKQKFWNDKMHCNCPKS